MFPPSGDVIWPFVSDGKDAVTCRSNTTFGFAALIVGALILSGCAETQLAVLAAKKIVNAEDQKTSGKLVTTDETAPVGKRRGRYKVGDPYVVAGVKYYPEENPDYDVTGIASWYGKPFHGRDTANGEVYDMNLLTAAHKTLPMPVFVRVTNLENGRAIELRVNDRGPFVNSRIIDVSRRAAQLLGFFKQGTAKVRVQIISGPGTKGRVLARGTTTKEERNAVKAAPIGAVQVAELAPPGGVAPIPKPVAAAPPTPKEVTQTKVAKAPEVFVQAGAFRLYENALKLKAQLGGMGPTKISSVLVDGKEYFRVRIGPIASVNLADRTLAGMIESGYTVARIVVD